MSLLLELGFADNTPSIGREYSGIDKSVMDEILSPIYPDYLKHDKFLSKEEQELLQPDYDSGTNPIYNYRNIDPLHLKQVFEKILEYLKNHHGEFPLVHMIHETESKSSGSSISEDFEYNGFKCHLDGFHNDYSYREKLRLVRYNNGWETIDWIKANPTISLAGKTFYVSTENKFEQYRNVFEELINICEQAIKADKKLLWLFSN